MAILDRLSDTELTSADNADRRVLAAQVVNSAQTAEEKKEVAAAAVDALTPEQRLEMLKGLAPQDSKDRKAVYIAGFVSSVIMALGLAGMAWGAANTGNEEIATATIAAALSLPSAIIGGLLGAYVTRS